jgi:hypothetical protein
MEVLLRLSKKKVNTRRPQFIAAQNTKTKFVQHLTLSINKIEITSSSRLKKIRITTNQKLVV